MGSGKSTVGRDLAQALKFSFIDMDTFIEERNFRSIAQLFEENGEQHFRTIERKALHELSEFSNVVIATGGGAPCFFDNMEVIRDTGKSIYLKGSPRILAERLNQSKIDRPLIKNKTEEELIAFIDETLVQREKWYSQADVILNFDHDIVVDEVLNILEL
jgi:shikimate kinase